MELIRGRPYSPASGTLVFQMSQWINHSPPTFLKRIAAPMVGGLVRSFLLQLTIYPAIFGMWKGRGLPGPRREPRRRE